VSCVNHIFVFSILLLHFIYYLLPLLRYYFVCVMLARLMSAHGNPGCQCKNETDALASLSERSCTLDDGSPGVILQLREDACFSTSYGSSACVMHDMIHDPLCNASVDVMPSYCVQPWCYVDLESCTKDSDEIVYRSSYFGVDSGKLKFPISNSLCCIFTMLHIFSIS